MTHKSRVRVCRHDGGGGTAAKLLATRRRPPARRSWCLMRDQFSPNADRRAIREDVAVSIDQRVSPQLAAFSISRSARARPEMSVFDRLDQP